MRNRSPIDTYVKAVSDMMAPKDVPSAPTWPSRLLAGLLVALACAVVGFALYVLNLMVGMIR